MVKRSKIEIEKLKTKMLRLLSSGLTYSDIEKIMKEQDNLPPRTFARYWKTLMKQEEEKLFKQKKDSLVGFIKRHEKRLRDAEVNCAQTNNVKW